MTYAEFDKELKSISLSKKEFAELVELHPMSVTNWKQTPSVPSWVKSWLNNYKKAQAFDKIKITLIPFFSEHFQEDFS